MSTSHPFCQSSATRICLLTIVGLSIIPNKKKQTKQTSKHVVRLEVRRWPSFTPSFYLQLCARH